MRLAPLFALAVATACIPFVDVDFDDDDDPAPRRCTEIGCSSGFAVDFQRASSWPPGRYRVEVTTDGVASRCEVSLPLSCNIDASCTGERSWTLGLSGCALPAASHALSGVMILSTPGTVRIAVSRDDVSLAMGEFRPQYRTVQPNGPGCEPICTQAPSATLTIAP